MGFGSCGFDHCDLGLKACLIQFEMFRSDAENHLATLLHSGALRRCQRYALSFHRQRSAVAVDDAFDQVHRW